MPPAKREWCEIAKKFINEGQERLQEQLVNPLAPELPDISIQEVAGEILQENARIDGVRKRNIHLARCSVSPSYLISRVPWFPVQGPLSSSQAV